MDKSTTGFEFLQELKAKNGKVRQGFSQFSKFMEVKAREKGIPISGQFELTPLCNFSCRMCYVHLTSEQIANQKLLPVETWKDFMHQGWKAGMVSATLTGGECLTYSGFDELYLYLQDLGCQVHILTNGFLLNESRIRFFLEHKPRSIQVTLYGWNDDIYERVTGQRAFSIVSANIRKAVEAGLYVTICVTPSEYLGEDVLETIRVAKILGNDFYVNSSLFVPREETGRAKMNFQHDTELYVRIYRLINELNGKETGEIDKKKLPPVGGPDHECTACGLVCGGGRSSFVIDWKGTLMPCNRLNIIHASPLEGGFEAAWKKINREANAWPRVPECEGCPYDSICQNCAANMLMYAEPGKQPKELCEQTMYYVQHGVAHIPECD